MPNGKTQDSYNTLMLSGWHLFLPFRLISRKNWYMLLTYQKAKIINTDLWFILVCSDLFFCRDLSTELTGYVKQNKHGDFIVSCQQERVRRSSVQRSRDAESDLGHLAALLQGCSANWRRSPAQLSALQKPGVSTRGFSPQRRRESIKLFPMKIGSCYSSSLLFISFLQLQDPYGRTEQGGFLFCFFFPNEALGVFQATLFFFFF